MGRFAIPDTASGKDIKAIRRKLGMVQGEFAELVHVRKQGLYDYLCGREKQKGEGL